MPATAHPRIQRRGALPWAVALLLWVAPAGRLRADEGATPDAYRTDDLTVPAGDHQLAGTLYVPRSAQPVPAVVFVHGAGPAVRDDGYHELARHFARNGIAALIYDKRGCGASTGDWTRAGLHDLADDALACVRVLRGRPEVNPARVGLWGLSQGASVVPLAAGRSADVAFVIAVGGCLDFERQMRYFRANVFRRRGHPPAARDVADKVARVQVDLGNRVRSGSWPAPRAVRDTCRFEFDLDQSAAWRQVRQPVLAVYGERDQQVPVADSSAALAAAQAGNRDFTLIVYPGASHSIGKTRTGELGEEWAGYAPGYLDDMTDWVRHLAGGAGRSDGWPRGRGVAEPPVSAGPDDRLRWYGSAPAQGLQFIGFAVAFLVAAAAGAVRLVRGPREWLARVATALSVLNLTLLAGLVVLTLGLSDQWEPSYPAALNGLPLAGSMSVALTLTVLALLVARRRAPTASRRRRVGRVLFAAGAVAFVPFLCYWNLLGLAWR